MGFVREQSSLLRVVTIMWIDRYGMNRVTASFYGTAEQFVCKTYWFIQQGLIVFFVRLQNSDRTVKEQWPKQASSMHLLAAWNPQARRCGRAAGGYEP